MTKGFPDIQNQQADQGSIWLHKPERREAVSRPATNLTSLRTGSDIRRGIVCYPGMFDRITSPEHRAIR